MEIGYMIRLKQKKGKHLFIKYGKCIKSPFESVYYMGKGVKRACVFIKENAEFMLNDIKEEYEESTAEIIRTDDKSLIKRV